jgi:hypothetical protein
MHTNQITSHRRKDYVYERGNIVGTVENTEWQLRQEMNGEVCIRYFSSRGSAEMAGREWIPGQYRMHEYRGTRLFA